MSTHTLHDQKCLHVARFLSRSTLSLFGQNAYMWPDSCPGAHTHYLAKNACVWLYFGPWAHSFIWPKMSLWLYFWSWAYSFIWPKMLMCDLISVHEYTCYLAKNAYMARFLPMSAYFFWSKMPTCGQIPAHEHTYFIWPKVPTHVQIPAHECLLYLAQMPTGIYLAKNAYMWPHSYHRKW